MSRFDFPGLIPDSIDLSEYMESNDKQQIMPASHHLEQTIDIIHNHHKSGTQTLPWAKTHNYFEFRPGEMSVWTGWKGHGKSILLSHVLLYLLAKGEKALIVSPEFSPASVLARKVRQASGGARPTESFIRQFLQWLDGKLWLFDHQGSLIPETILAVSRYAVDKFDVTHLLIDSLMKCGIAPDDYPAQKKFVDGLQSIAHQEKIHVHLVAHARKTENDDARVPGLHDIKGTSELADMAENVFCVWKNKKKMDDASLGGNKFANDPDAILKIDSQRNGDGWTGKIPLWFDQRSFQFFGSQWINAISLDCNTGMWE